MLYFMIFLCHLIFFKHVIFVIRKEKRRKQTRNRDLINICYLQIFFDERWHVNKKDYHDRPSQLWNSWKTASGHSHLCCCFSVIMLQALQQGTRGPGSPPPPLWSLTFHDVPTGLPLLPCILCIPHPIGTGFPPIASSKLSLSWPRVTSKLPNANSLSSSLLSGVWQPRSHPVLRMPSSLVFPAP